jgi:hypothetical protein
MGASIPMMRAATQTHKAWYSSDLSKDDKLMKLLETYHKVHISQEAHNGNYNKMLGWCLEHCQSKFRDIKHGDGMDWYFENDQDASMFAMKWS